MDEPDLDFEPIKSVTGALKKHYQYDQYDEVWAETYEHGVLIHKAGAGNYEWYFNERSSIAFRKVFLWGQRSKLLNRMMR